MPRCAMHDAAMHYTGTGFVVLSHHSLYFVIFDTSCGVIFDTMFCDCTFTDYFFAEN